MTYRFSLVALAVLCASSEAAFAQGRPVQRTVPPAVGRVAPQAGAANVDLRPDLVIRDIRRESEGTFRVLVANQGLRDAATFTVMLRLRFPETGTPGSLSPNRALGEVPALKAAEETWVRFIVSVATTNLQAVEASADPGYQTWNTGVGPGAGGLPSQAGPVWVNQRIVEKDETNNSLRIEVAALKAWP